MQHDWSYFQNVRVNKYRYWPASAVINRSIYRMETDTGQLMHCKLYIEP